MLIGYLPSLLEMKAWPGLIRTMEKFWDSENMVFWFREVETTSTIVEVFTSYESIDTCNKRKRQPDTDFLNSKIWDFYKIKEKLSLVIVVWMVKLIGPNIPFIKLYYRFGRARAYEKFKEEFISKEKLKEHALSPLRYAYLE